MNKSAEELVRGDQFREARRMVRTVAVDPHPHPLMRGVVLVSVEDVETGDRRVIEMYRVNRRHIVEK